MEASAGNQRRVWSALTSAISAHAEKSGDLIAGCSTRGSAHPARQCSDAQRGSRRDGVALVRVQRLSR